MSTSVASKELRLPGLDGLRGLACIMVFLYHLRWAAQPSTSEPLTLMIGSLNLEFLLRKFDIGVSIFFVLSGLLLSIPFWRAIFENQPAPELRRYLWRRACRIVPAYYAVLVAVYLLQGGTYTFYGAIDFLLHATFLHNFADATYHSLHPDLWTIGIEFQFYLLLPLIMAAAGFLVRKCGAAIGLLALIATCWLVDIAASAALQSAEPIIADRFLSATGSVIHGTVFSYLKHFAFGIVAAFAVLRGSFSRRTADGICLAAIAGAAAIITYGTEGCWHRTTSLGWPLSPLILAILAASLARSETCARVFSTKWIAATGTISYGIYLWHDLILRAAFSGTLRGNYSGFSLLVLGGSIAMIVTLTIAALSWRFIERDAIRTPYPFNR